MSSIVIAGDTSGTCTLQAANVAGNTVLNLPTTSGTLVTTGGAPSFTTVTTGLGNATAPSITFTGDTNTGIFSPTADTIAFTEGGVESMRIDASGRVGIGETNLNNTLTVRSATASVLVSSTTGTNGAYIQHTNSAGSFYVGRDNSAGSTFGVAYGSYLYSEGAYPLISWVNGSERMRITSAGNVGIGSTNPGHKLTISVSPGGSALNITDATASDFQIVPGVSSGVCRVGPAAGAMAFYADNAERGRFDTSGNFQFNSGYGSIATAYGCRAWVNFNGTGTVAIRASGNVSSITDDGTGRFRVNFTNAMPDANYSAVAIGRAPGTVTAVSSLFDDSGAYSTTQFAVSFYAIGNSAYADPSIFNVAIFR